MIKVLYVYYYVFCVWIMNVIIKVVFYIKKLRNIKFLKFYF